MPHIKIIILCASLPRITITRKGPADVRKTLFVHPAVYRWWTCVCPPQGEEFEQFQFTGESCECVIENRLGSFWSHCWPRTAALRRRKHPKPRPRQHQRPLHR